MIKHALALLLLVSGNLFASTFNYNVAVNTASLSASTGTLYFQFNPGDFTSDAATATISNFLISGPGSLTGAPAFSGDVSGNLGSSLVIANTFNNNDALQALTFGTGLSFLLSLDEAFTGTAVTGSIFNLGVYADDGITPLLTADPDGYSIVVNLDNVNGSAASSTTNLATIAPVVSEVPEPATVSLLCAGLAGLYYARQRKAKR